MSTSPVPDRNALCSTEASIVDQCEYVHVVAHSHRTDNPQQNRGTRITNSSLLYGCTLNASMIFLSLHTHFISKECRKHGGLLACWLSNTSALLIFIQKDQNMAEPSVKIQHRLVECNQRLVRYLINVVCVELDKYLLHFIHSLDSVFDDSIIPIEWNNNDSKSLEARWMSMESYTDNRNQSIFADNADQSTSNDIINTLSSFMDLIKKCYINTELKIQLFSQIFHHIDSLLSHRMTSQSGDTLSPQFRSRKSASIVRIIRSWAQYQELDFVYDRNFTSSQHCLAQNDLNDVPMDEEQDQSVSIGIQSSLTPNAAVASWWKHHALLAKNQLTTSDMPALTLLNNSGEYWCSITYYEHAIQVGEIFKVSNAFKQVTVDGGTDMEMTKDRFCLAPLSSVDSKDDCQKVKLHIGKGILLECRDKSDLWIRCKSEQPVFVQSYYLDRKINCMPGSFVHKYDSQAYFKVFDLNECFNHIHQQVKMAIDARFQYQTHVQALSCSNNLSVDDFRHLCVLRLSFVKGWGQAYPRLLIEETPCWIEIRIHHAFQLLDDIFNKLRSAVTTSDTIVPSNMSSPLIVNNNNGVDN